jgi:hypothetical protein
MRRGLHNGPEDREQRDRQDMQELDSRASLNDPESAGLQIAFLGYPPKAFPPQW